MKKSWIIFLAFLISACGGGPGSGGENGTYPDVAGKYVVRASDCAFAPMDSHLQIEQSESVLNISIESKRVVGPGLAISLNAPIPQGVANGSGEVPPAEELAAFFNKANVAKDGTVRAEIRYSSLTYNCAGPYIASSTELVCEANSSKCRFAVSKLHAVDDVAPNTPN